MTQGAVSATEPRTIERLLGRVDGPEPGPVVVCVAGMHGNEPAGEAALRRVLDKIVHDQFRLHGSFVAILGNLAALEQGVRFIDVDLNRHWTREHLRRLRARQFDSDIVEDRELVELGEYLAEALDGAAGETYVLDLHTTSAESAPFATVGDTLRNRTFAFNFPIPLILGLEEHLDGTMLAHFNDRGHITLGLEGGRHEDEASVDRLEAAVWLALAASGVLVDPRAETVVAGARRRLREDGAGVPRVLEVRHRHYVGPDDQFEMLPGYRSFQSVVEGEHLANDEGQAVFAPEAGLILMPLYQVIGDDGFFVARRFSRLWLTISAWLRRLRLDALLPWLPGVTRDPSHRSTLMIDGRVARWFALEVFHLLGYRKRRQMGDILVVSRRREGRRTNGGPPESGASPDRAL